ncbi:MAG: glucose-1-phosphate adenylyltransferase subunit GlgD [Oscillospiraceae bacterium]|nr:glucose-1-phosphate adenylyltransferase subunit GlgD [Oscillospiraceae bacterium]
MIQNDKKLMGIVFSNMHDELIEDLTKQRTMGSIPFGGRYRLIDFPLSNLVNSGVYDVGLITKSNYQSLMDHLGSGREWDLARKNGGLSILPPFNQRGYGLYQGKIDALAGALPYIRTVNAHYVILSDCNVICNMDYRHIMDKHISTGADITAVYANRKMKLDKGNDSTLFEIDANDKVVGVICDPITNAEVNISANIYVMSKQFLLDIVTEMISKGQYSLTRDLLQKRCSDLDIRAIKYEGLIFFINSMENYYTSNMSLLDTKIRNGLFDKERSIYTKVRDAVPVKYGLEAKVKNSLVAEGCIIEGNVENSILFRGVRVAKNATIRDSIIMQGTEIGEDCLISHVISDKNVSVSSKRSMMGTSDYPVYVSKGSGV